MSADKVSVEAFDRTAMALIEVIQEDAEIIDKLKAANAQLIEGAQKAWRQTEAEVLATGELRNKFERLLDLCDEQDKIADEFRVPREDGSIGTVEIRKILEP